MMSDESKDLEQNTADTEAVEEENAPETQDKWDPAFKMAMEIAVDNVRPMILACDQRNIPRQIMVIQLFTIAINGLIKHGWTLDDVLQRVRLHDFPELEEEEEEEIQNLRLATTL